MAEPRKVIPFPPARARRVTPEPAPAAPRDLGLPWPDAPRHVLAQHMADQTWDADHAYLPFRRRPRRRLLVTLAVACAMAAATIPWIV